MGLLEHAVRDYGYAAVGAGVFLESAGIPVPGETALLAAGFFAERGNLSLPVVMAVGAAAAIVGDNVGYLVGRRWGRKIFDRFFNPRRRERVERFFERHGAKTVFFSRFITGVRVVAALFAGMTGLPWGPFFLWNALGGIAWATAMPAAGYLLGSSWHALHQWLLVGGGVVAAVLLFVWWWRRRRGSGSTRPVTSSP